MVHKRANGYGHTIGFFTMARGTAAAAKLELAHIT